MDAPPVQFTRTSDGVSIAYTVAGSGPPLLFTWGSKMSDMEVTWRSPATRPHLKRLTEHFTLYQFDWRNTGSSTRGVPFGRDEWIRDLEAVFSLFDDPVSLIAPDPSPVSYVANNPERIRRLVTWNQARWPEGDPRGGAVVPYIYPLFDLDSDWLRLMARKMAGEVPEPAVREIEEMVLACCDPGYAAQVQPVVASWDIGADLERIAVPTLVVHRRGLGAEIGADYAAHIPGAKLCLVEGSSWYWPGEEDPLPAILAFLTGDDERLPAAPLAEGPGTTNGLSPREIDVIRLIAAGRSNRQIAEALVLSEATIATHVRHILQKTDSANRAEAASYAVRNGLA
ncbi:MAG: alpha/beta fold hydrolase [Dehalococcoidia bacterium]